MGYARALLARDVGREEKALQKKVKKKSLWGSIGRTAGGLLAMGLTGGLVNPLTLGLITGAASFAGGAIGAGVGGGKKLTGGKFFKSDRESLQKELGAFGTQNIVSSLRSGLSAGIGQKLKLMKAGKEGAKLSEGLGMDFGGSFVGKHGGTDLLHKFKQGKSDLLYGGDKTLASKEIAKGLTGYEFGTGVEPTTGFTGMPREDIPLLDSISKAPTTPSMKPMLSKQGLKSKFEDYFSPGRQQIDASLFERYPEMFKGSSMSPKI